MHRGLRVTLQSLLIVTGALIALPQVKGWFVYQRGQGVVLEVFPEDLGDGTVRLAVIWEFAAPTNDGAKAWLSYRLCDGLFRPLDRDPVVPAGRAEEAVRRWLDDGELRKRYRTVFYQAADPGATGMIMDESSGEGERRLPLGITLVLVGLCWMLFGRRATEWTTQWYARKDKVL